MAISDIAKANHYPIFQLSEDKIFVPRSRAGEYNLMIFDKKKDKFISKKEIFTLNFTSAGNISTISTSAINTEGSHQKKLVLSKNQLSSLNKSLKKDFSDQEGKANFLKQLQENHSSNTAVAYKAISTPIEKASNLPESTQSEETTNHSALLDNPASSVSSNTPIASKKFKNLNDDCKNYIKELFKKACQKDNQQEAQEAENLLFDLLYRQCGQKNPREI